LHDASYFVHHHELVLWLFPSCGDRESACRARRLQRDRLRRRLKDDSRAIVERYADRLTKIIFKQNGGQPSAANAAFEHTTGDLVFFLDSDDMYLPQIAERVLAVWHDGVAKVQFPMLNADGDGKLSGTIFPNFTVAFEPAAIRKTLFETVSVRRRRPPATATRVSPPIRFPWWPSG
jgi:hypothetical protein